jgi:hypothetical protein
VGTPPDCRGDRLVRGKFKDVLFGKVAVLGHSAEYSVNNPCILPPFLTQIFIRVPSDYPVGYGGRDAQWAAPLGVGCFFDFLPKLFELDSTTAQLEI